MIRKFMLICLIFSIYAVWAQQADLYQINKMPDKPEPYLMRNWKAVAMGFDSLVFNMSLTGVYLPLIWVDGGGINYPAHQRFGIPSYVGSSGAEAITVLPAVIGATLCGIDKSSQNGYNYVLMCEEFFNRRAQENVYLNNFVSNSGGDWWYDTMPNIFFYQLADLYPHTGDFDFQFTKVADRWLEAVKTMGGSAGPWNPAFMNYRAWALSTMTPLDVGVEEPEAAGAIAWILYNAFIETGEDKYRLGAEWCMEFLNSLSSGSNPGYELQLPYGVYTAARMNAELGTAYNITKMMEWCFDPRDNVRNWGATVGKWGGYDCAGLIGEAKFTGYAFAMNGFEQAGALVPAVRYDDRFAGAIGKWVLNLANASRLFYTNYLPDDHQDSEEWSHVYDPDSYIAHEALREYGLNPEISPFATGDAVRSGWAPTNFALYGASHVGILGGLIDTTNVSMILKLNMNKTDYYQDSAYPTYLLYNPYEEDKTVDIVLEQNENFDLYDAVSNQFIERGASGTASFSIPSKSACVVVETPSGGTVTYEQDKMLVDNVVVDFNSGRTVSNYKPRIKGIASEPEIILTGSDAALYCTAEDRDGDPLSYQWKVSGSVLPYNQPSFQWTGTDIGTYTFTCTVNDGRGGRDSASVSVEVTDFINHVPVIDSLKADPRKLNHGDESRLICYASDPDGENLSYAWNAESGTIKQNDSTAVWTAPSEDGFYYIFCTVEDGHNGTAEDSIGILVQDSTNISLGFPVLYLPFNGNADDESGNDHNGTVKGALLCADRFGNSEQAYSFNGSFDLIQVENKPDLNFQDAVSVSFWMKPEKLYTDRESYPISHGNWVNRWKISITPEKKLRWTVKTDKGIKDIDSQAVLEEGTYYYVTALYNGSDMSLYLNGIKSAQAAFKGKIAKTSLDLTIGQHVPEQAKYNFNGVLDEIRIYNYAVSDDVIKNLYNEFTFVADNHAVLPVCTRLLPNYPNPFNSCTAIGFQIKHGGNVRIEIFNLLGQAVKILINQKKDAGNYTVEWDGTDTRGMSVSSGIYICLMQANGRILRRKLLLLE